MVSWYHCFGPKVRHKHQFLLDAKYVFAVAWVDLSVSSKVSCAGSLVPHVVKVRDGRTFKK
jgi:hypothetical protein